MLFTNILFWGTSFLVVVISTLAALTFTMAVTEGDVGDAIRLRAREPNPSDSNNQHGSIVWIYADAFSILAGIGVWFGWIVIVALILQIAAWIYGW